MRFPDKRHDAVVSDHTTAAFIQCNLYVTRVVAVSTLGRVYSCHVRLSTFNQTCPCKKRNGRCSKVVVHQHVCWLAAAAKAKVYCFATFRGVGCVTPVVVSWPAWQSVRMLVPSSWQARCYGCGMMICAERCKLWRAVQHRCVMIIGSHRNWALNVASCLPGP